MGFVTLPHPLTDGTTAYGSQVRANDDAIVTQVNGNLVDANISTGAAISGSKLSNVAGLRVPTDRIEDDAVTNAKLRDSTTTDLDRAVTTDHIRDGAITAAKIGALAVILSKVKTAFTDHTFGDLSADGTNSQSTGITTATGLPLRVEVRRAGAPTAESARVQCSILLNTATNTYHLQVSNPDDGGILAMGGLTFRFVYIPVA